MAAAAEAVTVAVPTAVRTAMAGAAAVVVVVGGRGGGVVVSVAAGLVAGGCTYWCLR